MVLNAKIQDFNVEVFQDELLAIGEYGFVW